MTSTNNKKFTYITSIQRPLNDVFDFYSNPKNINKLTPWFAKVKAIPEKKLTPNAVFVIEINIFFVLKNKWKISCGLVDKEALVVNGKPKKSFNNGSKCNHFLRSILSFTNY